MDEAARDQLNRNMAALADGARTAFDPVYRELWPVLMRFIAAISRDSMGAEDIAQQAMLKILARISTFDRSKDALAWGMAIAANEYRSARRKHGRAAVSEQRSPPEEWLEACADHDTPEAIAIRDNLHEAARRVLGNLRPRDLEVVVAALYEGPRPLVSGVAFRKRLQRVMATTRSIWKRRYGDDGSP